MKKILLLLCLVFPAGLAAQTEKLSPYEHDLYGGQLWKVPREPYQSRYKEEAFKARLHGLPESAVKDRFQSRMEWENEQHDISERAGTPYKSPRK